jgi:hypothetical protein
MPFALFVCRGRRAMPLNEMDVSKVLVNPIYTMGSRPMVPDAQWLRAQEKLLEELGQEAYFRLLLQTLKETFGSFVS